MRDRTSGGGRGGVFRRGSTGCLSASRVPTGNNFNDNFTSSNSRIFNEIDISRNYGHGTIPVEGRESHTADLVEFDRYVEMMQRDDRRGGDIWEDVDDNHYYSDNSHTHQNGDECFDSRLRRQESEEGSDDNDTSKNNNWEHSHEQFPFNAKFWAFVRSILAKAVNVGYQELPDSNATVAKGPKDADAFLSKVIAIGLLNPIQPATLVKEGGFDEMIVLAELLHATSVGLVAMRFAPECVQCGSQVMDTDMLGRLPARANCQGCHAPNVIDSLDNIKVMFCLNSDVLYVLAENYSCTPSQDSMSQTAVFAAVPATSTGSGFAYSIGTGIDTEIAPALPSGRYRMHCPVAKTDNFLVVKRDSIDTDEPIKLPVKVSQLVYKNKRDSQKTTLEVPHGKISFHILPDTRSFFVLWIQKDVDDEILFHLPREERAMYTTASAVMHHPVFNTFFQEHHVVSAPTDVFLSISNVVLVFTDIVDSTKLYASVGDGDAFMLVRKHFQVLFSAFTRNGGRVVKTIGDAVMASFPNGRAAMIAVSHAMELLPTIGRRPDNNNYIEIRVGIHCGRATIVPLNGVNDYFGQTTNIAARVQSSAKASECFVTEAVLDGYCGAMETYEEITQNSCFAPTPSVDLKLKGVEEKVIARGFRWTHRSRRESELASSYSSRASYLNRGSHHPGSRVDLERRSSRLSLRSESEISDMSEFDNLEELPTTTTRLYERPAAMARRRSSLEKHDEE